MEVAPKYVAEFKRIYKKEYGKELNDAEAYDGASRLVQLAEIALDLAYTDHRRKLRLKKEPRGFRLEPESTYTCCICYELIAGEQTWYDKYGIKCLPCQKALERRVIPAYVCTEGKHTPIITKDLYDQALAQLKRDQIVRENKEFAFTKLFTCGYCQSGISAEEKYKQLKDGTSAKYVYYGCSRARDRNCKNKYIREEELIQQLLGILDQVNLNELGMRHKLEEEIKRFNKFNRVVKGAKADELPEEAEVNVRKYAKYLLKGGSVVEKRELLANLRSRLVYKDKAVTLRIE